MSAILTKLRDDLKTAIAAAEAVALTADQIVSKRKGNVWNAVTVAVQGAGNGICLHLSTPEADGGREGARRAEVTLAMTLVEAQPAAEDDDSLEQTAEALITFVERSISIPAPSPRTEAMWYHPLTAGWRLKSYAEIEVTDQDGGSSMPGIQLSFTRTLSII